MQQTRHHVEIGQVYGAFPLRVKAVERKSQQLLGAKQRKRDEPVRKVAERQSFVIARSHDVEQAHAKEKQQLFVVNEGVELVLVDGARGGRVHVLKRVPKHFQVRGR